MSEYGTAAEQARELAQDDDFVTKMKAQAEPQLKAWRVLYHGPTGNDRYLSCLTDGEDTFPTAEDFTAMILARTGLASVWVISWEQIPH